MIWSQTPYSSSSLVSATNRPLAMIDSRPRRTNRSKAGESSDRHLTSLSPPPTFSPALRSNHIRSNPSQHTDHGELQSLCASFCVCHDGSSQHHAATAQADRAVLQFVARVRLRPRRSPRYRTPPTTLSTCQLPWLIRPKPWSPRC